MIVYFYETKFKSIKILDPDWIPFASEIIFLLWFGKCIPFFLDFFELFTDYLVFLLELKSILLLIFSVIPKKKKELFNKNIKKVCFRQYFCIKI